MNKQMSEHQVVVVTGASAGIGRSAAIEIAARGMGVVITYRSRPDDAQETVSTIQADGGSAVALPLDVGRSETFQAFKSELGRVLLEQWNTDSLYGLVNNAGFGGGLPFEDMTEETFDQYYQVLLRGPYFLTQTLLPLLRNDGAIVSTSSSSVRPGDTQRGYSGYAAMKGGLVVSSRYLAKELSPRGIRVNTIAPGPTRTRIGDDAFEKYPEVIDSLAANTALGRIGEPEDIGKVIAFLVSDQSGWITGEDIHVAGGYAL